MRRTNRFICFLKYELISVVSVDKRCMYIYIYVKFYGGLSAGMCSEADQRIQSTLMTLTNTVLD